MAFNKDTTISIPNSNTDLKGASKKSLPKRILRIILKVILWILGIILFIILIYSIWTLISNHVDNNTLDEYDRTHSKKVDVRGHKMSYNIYGESNNVTIIALTGLGSCSPILELKTLTEELSDKYRVITLEPFGYGFSETIDSERTVENVYSEYYEGAKQLGVDKYYLMAHSLGGIYSLQWALDHPNEVLGFIGLDVTVPRQVNSISKEEEQEMINYYKTGRIQKNLGLYRVGEKLDNTALDEHIDPKYKNYSEEEKEIGKLLCINRSFSDNLMNEVDHLYENIYKLYGKKFPENVPVLNFIASESNKLIPSWEKFHQDEISNTTHSEVIVLEGSHYIYLYQKPAIIKKINEWIN